MIQQKGNISVPYCLIVTANYINSDNFFYYSLSLTDKYEKYEEYSK